MSESQAPAAGADDGAARDEGLSSVSDAVRELERRDRERAAARKAAADQQADADDDDDEPQDRRKVANEDEDEDREPKKREKRAADDDSDDDGEAGDGDDESGDDGDDGEDDAEDEPKPKPKPEPEQPARVKLQIDGREIEATPAEVSEYVREATAQRQQLEQQRQQIAQQAQALQQQGQALAQVAQQLLGQEPDLTLAQTDPGAYIAQQAQYRQRMALLQTLQGHTSQAAQHAQAQQQQAFAATVERERQALLKAMPELADPAKLSAFSGRIAKVAQRYGLSPQELQTAYDHRSYLMLHDLCRLADMEAERASVRKKLKGAPPLQQPEQRASTGQRNTADLRAKDAKSAFLKSGRSMRDVRDYLARTER